MPLVKMLFAAALLGSAVPACAAAPLLSPQPPIAVPGGSGSFDYMQIDLAHHRLLASHPGKATLVVLNLQTHAVQQLDTGVKINGIAVDAADNKLFAAGGGGKLIVFDNTTLAKTAEVTLGGPGDDVVLDTKTDTLYVCHDDAAEDWVFDAKTNALMAAAPIAGAPEYVMYDPSTDRLYQNIKPTNLLQVINPGTHAVEASWPTAPMTSPHGLAIDFKTHHVFSAGQGEVVMLDEITGKVLASAAIAPSYVDQIAFDPDTQRLYCACGTAGAVAVVQEDGQTIKTLEIVPTHPKSHTLTVDPETHSVWISYTDATGSYLQEMVPGK